jgi:hypothetical protein
VGSPPGEEGQHQGRPAGQQIHQGCPREVVRYLIVVVDPRPKIYFGIGLGEESAGEDVAVAPDTVGPETGLPPLHPRTCVAVHGQALYSDVLPAGLSLHWGSGGIETRGRAGWPTK